MKLAICFFGNMGWYNNSNGVKKELALECLSKTINQIITLNKDSYFFGHLWSGENTDKLLDLPFTNLIIEDQRIFQLEDDFTNKYNFGNQMKYDLYLKRRFGSDKEGMISYASKVKSRWYSTQCSILLADKFSKENNLKFDNILLLRYDLVLTSSFKLPVFKNKIFLGDSSNYSSTLLPFLARIVNLFPLSKIAKVQPNALKYSLTSFINYPHVSDTWTYGNYAYMLKLSRLFDEFENFHMSPHISLLQFYKKEKIKISFINEQGKDYNLYRFQLK
ncbi:hypothetical protein [Aurantibacter sp.]|uniref:hypothetical protein n=1 Tax=Aurantibacter sp. TaxID=2807103 RepID=UPI0035C8116C